MPLYYLKPNPRNLLSKNGCATNLHAHVSIAIPIPLITLSSPPICILKHIPAKWCRYSSGLLSFCFAMIVFCSSMNSKTRSSRSGLCLQRPPSASIN